MAGHHRQRVHTEPVVLDIGKDTGALIIYTGPDLLGREIEISPAGLDTERTHTDVQERRFAGRTVYAAVFPPLPVGGYTLWRARTEPAGSVTIGEGQVTQVDWSEEVGTLGH